MYGLSLTLTSFFAIPNYFTCIFPCNEKYFALKSHSILVILEGSKSKVIDVSGVYLSRSPHKVKRRFHFERLPVGLQVSETNNKMIGTIGGVALIKLVLLFCLFVYIRSASTVAQATVGSKIR